MSILYRDTTLTKIFVGGLPYHTTDESLQKFFDQFGAIEEAVVITDRHSGKSKGYGFVTMADRVGAERACKDPNPIIDGRKANVNLAYLGAKPRLQAGELLSFPINLKTGLATAYPAQLSRITPFIQPATPAFITHTAALAPYTPIHSINHNGTIHISNNNTTNNTNNTNNNNNNGTVTTNNNGNCNGALYPVTPTTPNESPNGMINYAPAAFTYPQLIHPGFEQAPAGFAPFSVIGYISPSPVNGPYAPLQPHFQQLSSPDPHSPTTLGMAPAFVPALHCLPPQQIMH